MKINYIGTARELLNQSMKSRNVFMKIAYALQAIAYANIVIAEEAVRQTAIKAEEWYGAPEETRY